MVRRSLAKIREEHTQAVQSKSIGFRKLVLASTMLPALVTPLVTPAVAYLRGEWNFPHVLLSDFSSLPFPLYAFVQHISWVMFVFGSCMIVNEYCADVRKGFEHWMAQDDVSAKSPSVVSAEGEEGKKRVSLGGRSTVDWMEVNHDCVGKFKVVCGCQQFWVSLCAFPAILSVVCAAFPERDPYDNTTRTVVEMFKYDFEKSFIPWVLHCGGAFVAATCGCLMAFYYVTVMAPVVQHMKLEPAEGIVARAHGSKALIATGFASLFVRCMHMFYNREKFAVAMLVCEIALFLSSAGTMLVSFWKWCEEKDAAQPIFNFPVDFMELLPQHDPAWDIEDELARKKAEEREALKEAEEAVQKDEAKAVKSTAMKRSSTPITQRVSTGKDSAKGKKGNTPRKGSVSGRKSGPDVIKVNKRRSSQVAN